MFNLFLNPHGELPRKSFWIAIAVFTVVIYGLGHVMSLMDPTMLRFFLVGAVFVVLLYSFYQVCKKRLHHMGLTARPFWMFLFLLIFLWIGAALYFGVGEHFNVLFEYNDQFKRGEITEDRMLELIEGREAIMTQKLSNAKGATELLLTVPAIGFLIWLGLAPHRQKQA